MDDAATREADVGAGIDANAAGAPIHVALAATNAASPARARRCERRS